MDATVTLTPAPVTSWSNMLKKQPDSKPHNSPTTQVLVGSCKSSKGIAYAPLRRQLGLHPRVAESIVKVEKFARATGDIGSLSKVDCRLIALTYTLEAQKHGTEHLRDCPPPVLTVNVRRLPEKDLSGWDNNVRNLEEWEALGDKTEDKSNSGSRILPLKDINLNVVDDSDNQEGGDGIQAGRHGRCFPRKKKITIEGRKMVSEGIDASQGKVDENADEWMPGVSRSTHRRFLRRKARRESNEAALADYDHQHGTGENTSDIYASVDTLFMNDDSSEQSSTVRSLSESSVACIPGDFAMQNVILQMGLRLLAPGGMQIRQLKRWILKCHGCNTVTAETGRMFCPKCGSGGTLLKVEVTVSENGIVLAARPRINKRGNRVSLPLPQGGRNAITKNPILREDQLPSKVPLSRDNEKSK